MEVYINDFLVKLAWAEDHIDHLKTCFDILNKYYMKLNPTKCTFGVTSGEFLAYIIAKRGIKANPKQILLSWNSHLRGTKEKSTVYQEE
ncbi:hypothetical protein V5N11_015996 [Cardamine amara subsp. amara]|uniref:Reverse transcriptase domain-containing protein n=1 Tax=Cardamine amara subsp. amara TaxID=228776 RepID=A0ABD0ZCU3_CARAN